MANSKNHLLLSRRASVGLAAIPVLERLSNRCKKGRRDRRRLEVGVGDLFGLLVASLETRASQLGPDDEPQFVADGARIDLEVMAPLLGIELTRAQLALLRCHQWGILTEAPADVLRLDPAMIERGTLAAHMNWATMHNTVTGVRRSPLPLAILRLIVAYYPSGATSKELCVPHQMPVSIAATSSALGCREATVAEILDELHEIGILFRDGAPVHGSRRTVRWSPVAFLVFTGVAPILVPEVPPLPLHLSVAKTQPQGSVPATGSPDSLLQISELERLAALRRSGDLTPRRYEIAMRRIFGE